MYLLGEPSLLKKAAVSTPGITFQQQTTGTTSVDVTETSLSSGLGGWGEAPVGVGDSNVFAYRLRVTAAGVTQTIPYDIRGHINATNAATRDDRNIELSDSAGFFLHPGLCTGARGCPDRTKSFRTEYPVVCSKWEKNNHLP